MIAGEIIDVLEAFAPSALQEDYDNTGLQVGSRNAECTGVMLCVDVRPETVDEAVSAGCNLIVSHHPLIFHGLKRLTGSSATEVAVMNAIAAGVSIYSCHTSIDNAQGGVSHRMAAMLGLDHVTTLDHQADRLLKLTVFVPVKHADAVRLALFDAGAGRFGRYDSCSYSLEGRGTFRALDGARPFVGMPYEYHTEAETRIEVLLPVWRRAAVEEALLATHPYEEPAYEFFKIDAGALKTGCGTVGNLPASMSPAEFVDKVKRTFGSPVARCCEYPAANAVRRVAMCGGAGSFLIRKAIAAGAQAFITSDTKYHDFVDCRNQILIVDIGHFESESCTKEIFYQIIKEKFPNFAVRYSVSDTNPIIYM